jgi:Domain of unknown function (DUF3291)
LSHYLLKIKFMNNYQIAQINIARMKGNELPTIEEAVEKLDYLQINGTSEAVFDFREKFSPPSE